MSEVLYGDLQIINGKVINLIAESLTADPDFSANDTGRIYFNSTEGKLKYNNGVEYIDSEGDNTNLITTLGNTWINSDLSFNPNGFSQFSKVKNLTSENTLIDVLFQLDQSINDFKLSDLLNVENINLSGVITTGQLLYYNGENYTFGSIDLFLKEYSELDSSFLQDVSKTSPSDGQIYIWNGIQEKFINNNVSFTYRNFTASTTHTVNHNLQSQFCCLTIIDLNTNSMVTSGYGVSFDSDSSLTVSLDSSLPIAVFVFAIPINQIA